MEGTHPYASIEKEITVGDKKAKIYSLSDLNDARIGKEKSKFQKNYHTRSEYCLNLPLEIVTSSMLKVRFASKTILETDVEKILDWEVNSQKDVEIPFKPARVILQDFT
jgi:aconitate hydratase